MYLDILESTYQRQTITKILAAATQFKGNRDKKRKNKNKQIKIPC